METEQLQDKENFDKDIQWAQWRFSIIEPLLVIPPEELAQRVRVHAKSPHLTLDGKKRTLTATTLWNWIEAYQRDGLKGLMRKYRRSHPKHEQPHAENEGTFVHKTSSHPTALPSEHLPKELVLEKLERTFSSLWEQNQRQAQEIQAAMELLQQLHQAFGEQKQQEQ